jgi:metal-responsive CopG/Arc/MetJ family transcriptional regulator
MKVAISVPDDLFEQADQMAADLNLSRSGLYTRALREYLIRTVPDPITEKMNRVVDQVGSGLDDFGRRAAQTLVARIE